LSNEEGEEEINSSYTISETPKNPSASHLLTKKRGTMEKNQRLLAFN
jgi:hypothetical protein